MLPRRGPERPIALSMLVLAAAACACLLLDGRVLAPSWLLMRPTRTPPAGWGSAPTRPEASRQKREARETSKAAMQQLVQREGRGILGQYFDDAYAKKHWFEKTDANADATPELDIPDVQDEPDAVPTAPKLSQLTKTARAKVLDHEAGLQHPLSQGSMASALSIATERAERVQSLGSNDHDGLRLRNEDSAGPVDKAAGQVEHGVVSRVVEAAVKDTGGATPHGKLSAEDLQLLQDARERQAKEKGLPLPDALPSTSNLRDGNALPAGGKTLLSGLTPEEEPKADDSPIGVASAAKILKDAEVLDESNKGDAMDKWKDAAKGSGPAILDAIKDDVSVYSPFPKSSLSERMEVEDVWNRARAAAKSAGTLDGNAAETKKTIQNAEAQAEGQAYLAANEAAAVDAYDVSFPNPDMMAKGGRKSMATRALATTKGAHIPAMQPQALATREHRAHLLHGQASAVGYGRHHSARAAQALAVGAGGRARQMALAEVESRGSIMGADDADLQAADAARKDEQTATRRVEQLQLKVAVAKGEAKEAARLRGFTSNAALSARAKVTKYQLEILKEGGVAQEARKLATEFAGEIHGAAMQLGQDRARATHSDFKQRRRRAAELEAEKAVDAVRAKRKTIMRLEDRAARLSRSLSSFSRPAHGALQTARRGALRTRMRVGSGAGQLGFADADVGKAAAKEPLLQQQLGDAAGAASDRGGFDRAHSWDARVAHNNNQISDVINGALGDDPMSIGAVDAYAAKSGNVNVHNAMLPPYNSKDWRDQNHMVVTNAGGWSVNNNMNQGQDPLKPFGVFDSRTAADIYTSKKSKGEKA